MCVTVNANIIKVMIKYGPNGPLQNAYIIDYHMFLTF